MRQCLSRISTSKCHACFLKILVTDLLCFGWVAQQQVGVHEWQSQVKAVANPKWCWQPWWMVTHSDSPAGLFICTTGSPCFCSTSSWWRSSSLQAQWLGWCMPSGSSSPTYTPSIGLQHAINAQKPMPDGKQLSYACESYDTYISCATCSHMLYLVQLDATIYCHTYKMYTRSKW